jgi:hypothetical protein
VPRAVKHAWAIRHTNQVLQNLIHVLAGKKEDEDHRDAKDEMKSLHRCRRATTW